jgi:methylated-DNA-protein-cysteine methyltransferase related protein
MSEFREKVIECIRSIPKGQVASYGQIAAACGHPRAARQVGAVLKSLDITEKWKKGKSRQRVVPWWRVINSAGAISIKGNWTATKELQAELLRGEGIEVAEGYKINMKKYRITTSYYL